MDVDGKHYRTIWRDGENRVHVIDQRALPFAFETQNIGSWQSMAEAISDMTVRGAGCIGAAGGYGMFLAAMEAAAATTAERNTILDLAARTLATARPTAVNLTFAVDRMRAALSSAPGDALVSVAAAAADAIADDDVAQCRAIGEHGLELLSQMHQRSGRPINVLTHCNAGWLAFVDHGTATAPIYAAHDAGIPIHVWVDETRPRNQGARLTAWELGQHGVDHTVIVDNAGGHLMQRGMVDAVIVGSDRTASTGDVANKIGTYLKALAAQDNGVPFYAALPTTTIDWNATDGLADIPIEERSPTEVTEIAGLPVSGPDDGELGVCLVPHRTGALNYGFDVTPARLVTALITEHGVVAPDVEALAPLRPQDDRLP